MIILKIYSTLTLGIMFILSSELGKEDETFKVPAVLVSVAIAFAIWSIWS